MEGEWLCSVSNKDVYSTEKCIKKICLYNL